MKESSERLQWAHKAAGKATVEAPGVKVSFRATSISEAYQRKVPY